MAFDLGVACVVVGAVLMALAQLAQVAQRAASRSGGAGMSLEFLVASTIAVLVAGGIYLALRGRTFQVVLGLTLLSYAVNLFLFAIRRLIVDRPPLYAKDVVQHADPLPQALVLTNRHHLRHDRADRHPQPAQLSQRVGSGRRRSRSGWEGCGMTLIDHLSVAPVVIPAIVAPVTMLVMRRRRVFSLILSLGGCRDAGRRVRAVRHRAGRCDP
jgi:hypothetical protein